MTTSDKHLETPLWDYAAERWHQPDLQALLLLLQEQYDFRINILLLACWAGAEGKCFTPEALIGVHEKTLHWHESTVKTLRIMRRSITPSEDTINLIDTLREAELKAEKIELLRLYEACHDDLFQTNMNIETGLATLHNLLIIFEMAPANWHLDLLVQLSCLVNDSLDEARATELIGSIRTP